jgi:hypothetical protein
MELTNSQMNERQRGYRALFRSRIAGWYNGWLHVAVIYAIGLTAMYVYAENLNNIAWWEWLTVPTVLLLCNIFEWFLHRHVMHRPVRFPGMKAVYTRHTLMHHQFFTDTEMRFADHKDWRVTFFPPFALVVFILMSIPGAVLMGWLISPNVGWLIMASTTGMYMLYEFMHFCCHVEENAFVRHCPFVNTIRRHHTAHHKQSIMMERNMNLTFPFADWLFGTSDLDRGLLGHLFNGYSTKHLRTDLRKTSRTPRARKAQGAGATA